MNKVHSDSIFYIERSCDPKKPIGKLADKLIDDGLID